MGQDGSQVPDMVELCCARATLPDWGTDGAAAQAGKLLQLVDAPQQHPQLQPQLLQLVDRLLQRLHIVFILNLVVPGDVILLVPVAELIQVLTLGQPVPLGDRFLRHRNSTWEVALDNFWEELSVGENMKAAIFVVVGTFDNISKCIKIL